MGFGAMGANGYLSNIDLASCPLMCNPSWYLQASTHFQCFMVARIGRCQGLNFYTMFSIVTVHANWLLNLRSLPSVKTAEMLVLPELRQ